MPKSKTPKGTRNSGCINLLHYSLRDNAINDLGREMKGSDYGISWADAQLQELELSRMRLQLHQIANARITHAINKHPLGPYRGAQAILRPDATDLARKASIESKAQAIRGKLSTVLTDMLHAFRPLHLGFARDKEGMRNVVREVFGRSTGDQEAAQYAQGWKQMAEYTRKRMNAAGATIPKLDDWGMPQHHDSYKVGQVSAEEWTKDIWAHLDVARMVDETGLTDAQLYEFLRDQTYYNISTDGAHKLDLNWVSGKPQGKSNLNRLREHRFLHFKDGDSWLEYQDKYGTDDYLTSMVTFIDQSSITIAAMEVLGPNPEIGYNHIRKVLTKAGHSDKLESIDMLYQNLMGRVGTSNVKAAAVMSTIRSFNVAAHLGNATLSMITDPAFLAMTAHFNDVPVFKTIFRQLSIAVKSGFGSEEDLKFASRIGFAADYAMNRLIATSRFTDTHPTKWMGRLSEITMRASWLHGITVAGRAAFQLEYAAAIAKDFDKDWTQLDGRRIKAFQSVGISPSDWDWIRNSTPVMKDGVAYVDINNVGKDYGKEVATNLFALINKETDLAVITPRSEARAIQNQGTKRGTFKGEVIRSAFEFKSFPITMALTHMRRMWGQQSVNRAGYAGAMMVTLLGLGYLAYTAKEISKGRDVPPLVDDEGNMDYMQFMKVVMQSGGLGIYGDLLTQDYTRFGMSLGTQLAGPTAAGAQDLVLEPMIQITKAANEALEGEGDDKEWNKLMRLISDNVQTYKPEVWQVRGLLDRAVNKAFIATIDPGREDKIRRAEDMREKELGQENFWAEDEWAPERPPKASEGKSN